MRRAESHMRDRQEKKYWIGEKMRRAESHRTDRQEKKGWIGER